MHTCGVTKALLGRAYKVLNNYKKAEDELNVAILLGTHPAAAVLPFSLSLGISQLLLLLLMYVWMDVWMDGWIDTQNAALYIERGDVRFRTGQRIKIIESVYDFDKAINLLHGALSSRTPPVASHDGTAATTGGGSFNKRPSGRGSTFLRTNASSTGSPIYHRAPDSSPDDFDLDMDGTRPLVAARDSGAVRSTHHPPGAVVPSSYYREVDDQLADAYYKRSQAKLMTDPSAANIESALDDAKLVRQAATPSNIYRTLEPLLLFLLPSHRLCRSSPTKTTTTW
jgi:hypothetical protein